MNHLKPTPRNFHSWQVLFSSLWDWGRGRYTGEEGIPRLVPGVCIQEWIALWNHDYDDVDRMLIDLETIGGG